MVQIGQFTRTQSGYAGQVRTPLLDIELAFVLIDKGDVENAPDYRIHLGTEDGPEIGAGWKHTGDRVGAYISMVIDDPTPPQPIRARPPRQPPHKILVNVGAESAFGQDEPLEAEVFECQRTRVRQRV